MKQQPTASLFECFESTPVALYDMSISDVKERAEKRLVFDSGIKAANFLGVTTTHFYASLKPGRYLYQSETRAKYAGRRISINKQTAA